MTNSYSEDTLVEQPAIALFYSMNRETADVSSARLYQELGIWIQKGQRRALVQLLLPLADEIKLLFRE